MSLQSCFACAAIGFLFLAPIHAADSPAAIHPQIVRVVEMAKKKADWETHKTLSSKMWALRKQINENLAIVSEPVSDRYFITKLAGPIDWVHFLALSAQTCSGEMTVEAALMAQWKGEGGDDFVAGTAFGSPPEAHPDDLPSNALGALLGSELAARENDPTADIAAILNTFFAPTLPATDEVAKRFSHRTIVMGLTPKSSWAVEKSRSEWFSALPIFILTALDPELRKTTQNATQALRKAGFEVYKIEDHPIGIRRFSRE